MTHSYPPHSPLLGAYAVASAAGIAFPIKIRWTRHRLGWCLYGMALVCAGLVTVTLWVWHDWFAAGHHDLAHALGMPTKTAADTNLHPELGCDPIRGSSSGEQSCATRRSTRIASISSWDEGILYGGGMRLLSSGGRGARSAFDDTM